MKFRTLLIVLVILSLTFTLTACEHSSFYEEDGLRYQEFDGMASVLGFVDDKSAVKDLVIKGITNMFPEYYVSSISYYAFENFDVETVTIEYYKAPCNVFHSDSSGLLLTFESILYRAFRNCKQLRKVNFPKEMMTICAEAFSGCESLEEITFPWGLKTIESKAFSQCSKLSVVYFDEKFEFLGANAFVDCAEQMTLYMKCPPPTVDGEAFSWGSKINVVVPQSLFESYTNHEYWGRFNISVE